MRLKSLRLNLAEEPRVTVADEADVVADTPETMIVCVEFSVLHVFLPFVGLACPRELTRVVSSVP
jgi:hypothetical protein